MPARRALAQRICTELTIHAQVEEELLQDELDELGQEMHARKAELMEEHGLMMDAETSELAMMATGRQARSGTQQGAHRGSR